MRIDRAATTIDFPNRFNTGTATAKIERNDFLRAAARSQHASVSCRQPIFIGSAAGADAQKKTAALKQP
ncbi:hypothetical protein D1006_26695 [Burkholderia stabilis]|uniref:Uncharacterized protein n=1 Tax=Burkholderia stabilis TaxID=95485 RepID=A0A4Q2AGJ7_9BURK|nr:hypothetical protein [Burkholderia stabilis]RXV68723.1 hypothetical protein D1006_26695 [Burkholderia stabilis]